LGENRDLPIFMRLGKYITVGAVLLLAQLSAFGAEVAVLKNGFSIRFEHKEQTGNVTRLYTGTGYVDIATDQIASYEVEETPVIPTPQPAAAPAPAAAANAAPAPAANVSAAGVAPAQQPAAQVGQQAAVNSQKTGVKRVSVQKVAPQAAPAQPAPAHVQAVAGTTQVAPTADLDQVIREVSQKNRLDPDFVSSVIKAESNYRPTAVSKKGARGLMQLMPATATELGVTNPFDPRANVEAGAAHLSALLDKYHDDPIKALAAYNAGAHRVKQYNGVPPYRETRAYISKIVRDFNARKRAQMKAPAATKSAKGKSAATPGKSVNAAPAKKGKQEAQIAKAASPA
jgi:soluble lytic murein transglycosylase-like protein